MTSDAKAEVWRSFSEPFASDQSGTAEQEVERRTRRSDLVAIVDVGAIRGQLTPAQDWVVSNVEARVETLLKNISSSTASNGSNIRFQLEGGEVALGGSRLRGVHNLQLLPEEGRRYLCFFVEYDGRLITDGMALFDVTDHRLERLYHRPLGALDGASEDWAVTEVLAKSALPKLKPGEVVP